MKKVIILLFIVINIILLSGCVNPPLHGTKETPSKDDIKEIFINGVDEEQEINSDIPIVLTVNGVRNTITVTANTPINKIFINGVDITINLPEGIYPEIEDNGVRTKIEYYRLLLD